MSSHEEVPPPYPGSPIPTPFISDNVLSKGDYKDVPIYENSSAIYQPISQQRDSSTTFPTHPVRIGRHAVHCICPQCHQQIVTYVNYESGVFAWLMCLLLTVIGCIPCCVIPFCVSSCQDATHVCPHCSAIIGRHRVL